MTSSSSSSSSPHTSWLALERYHLGEIETAEREAIELHLAECEACALVLAEIKRDDDRALPELPKKRKKVVRAWFARPQVALLAGLAVAAVLVLVIGRTPKPSSPEDDRIKGSSDVGFTLVREDEAVLPEAGGPYRDGERFKALVTCAPGLRGTFDLVVYEANAPPSFPLAVATGDLACGNAVPLAGAFRLTGHEPMTVCLVWQADGAIDRAMLARAATPASLPLAQCKLLRPAP